MTWRDWFAQRKQRGSGPPIPIVPEDSRYFGPGAAHQQAHEILLRESLGIADAATRAIANRLASLTAQVTTTRIIADGTEETEILDDHPLKLLLDKPHPNISYRQLLRLTGQWIVTTGEAYWRKVGSGFRVPIELHPIPPQMVEPIVQRGVLERYLVTDANGQHYPVPADTMIRIYFPDPENPWRSEGYLGPSAITLDAYKFASEHLRAFFQFDATPKVVLEGDREADAPAPGSPVMKAFEEKWIQSYARRSAGDRQGVPRMLAPGWTAHELTAMPGEAAKAYLDFWRDELLMSVGGVPRSVLGQVVSGDRSSAEVNQWVFDMYAVTPIALLIADALTLQLASDFEGDIQVGFAPFVSEDKEYELKRESQDLERGVRTINRILTDREDDEVPWGDKPLMTTKLRPYDPNAPVANPNGMPGTQGEVDAEDDEEPERLARDLHARIRRLERAAKRNGKAA